MTFWELFVALASAASIISAAIALTGIFNGRATRRLFSRLHNDTLAVLERMDQRNDDRHKEVVEMIARLRA